VSVGAELVGHIRLGYARVSAARQSLDTQMDCLTEDGVTRVFSGLGIYALICNRVTGRLLGKAVRNPRLWGTGMLFMVSSLAFVSWTPLIIGLGITVVGHTVKPTG
jgi:hypothetical protein